MYLPPGFAERLGEHLSLTGLTLLIALLIALPVGFLISRHRRWQGPVLGLLGIVYTIPSLALLAFLVPFLGLGRVPALLALVLYSLVGLVRNVVVGFAGVDPAAVEAARGMGMTGGQVFRLVEVPLALPVILAGVRVTTLAIISLTTIAAWIGAGGLGGVLRDGLLYNDHRRMLVAMVAVTLMAIAADLLFRAIEWLNTGYTRAGRGAGVKRET